MGKNLFMETRLAGPADIGGLSFRNRQAAHAARRHYSQQDKCSTRILRCPQAAAYRGRHRQHKIPVLSIVYDIAPSPESGVRAAYLALLVAAARYQTYNPPTIIKSA
jgi:hypothetical protein